MLLPLHENLTEKQFNKIIIPIRFHSRFHFRFYSRLYFPFFEKLQWQQTETTNININNNKQRYVAIMKPLKPRMSKRNNLAIAAVIWLVSAIIACPMLLFFTTDVIASKDGLRTVCYSEWPDGSTNHSQHEYM